MPCSRSGAGISARPEGERSSSSRFLYAQAIVWDRSRMIAGALFRARGVCQSRMAAQGPRVLIRASAALDGLTAAKAELRHIEIRAIMPPFSGCVRLSVPKLSD
jgi:hypothetical protein